jgi:hypothetical protein
MPVAYWLHCRAQVKRKTRFCCSPHLLTERCPLVLSSPFRRILQQDLEIADDSHPSHPAEYIIRNHCMQPVSLNKQKAIRTFLFLRVGL